MKKYVLLTLTFGLLNFSFAQSTMSKEKFTDFFKERAQEEYKHITFKVFTDLYLASYFNSKDFGHNLEDYYRRYEENTTDLENLLLEFLGTVQTDYTLEANYTIDASRIVPILKTSQQLEKFQMSGQEFVYDEFIEDLIIMYAEDEEEGIPGYRFFTKEEFQRSGIEREELYELAMKNLKEMLPDPSKVMWEHKEARYWSFKLDYYGSKYMSGLILLPEFLNNETERLGGKLIITIPSISNIGVLSVKDKSQLEHLLKVARVTEKNGGQSAITSKLYQWNGSKLKEY